MQCEKLRYDTQGSTHPYIFDQIQKVFQLFESVRSARIEGNHTTISEYVEANIFSQEKEGESINEIRNIQKAIDFIHSRHELPIHEHFVHELHSKVVE